MDNWWICFHVNQLENENLALRIRCSELEAIIKERNLEFPGLSDADQRRIDEQLTESRLTKERTLEENLQVIHTLLDIVLHYSLSKVLHNIIALSFRASFTPFIVCRFLPFSAFTRYCNYAKNNRFVTLSTFSTFVIISCDSWFQLRNDLQLTQQQLEEARNQVELLSIQLLIYKEDFDTERKDRERIQGKVDDMEQQLKRLVSMFSDVILLRKLHSSAHNELTNILKCVKQIAICPVFDQNDVSFMGANHRGRKTSHHETLAK